MSRVLLIEDDLDMSKLIVDYLEKFNFLTNSFESPLQALEFLKKEVDSIDIIILDLMLPELDGFDVLKEIKKIRDIPVIISSARGDMGNKIYGYEMGADDYLAKPYEPRELVLKVEVILKRFKKDEEKVSDFLIKNGGRSVSVDGFKIDFTKLESEIFLFLIKHKEKIVSREQLINGTSLEENTKNRTVDMHISNIRYKIGDEPKTPKYIKSIWGVGYKFIG